MSYTTKDIRNVCLLGHGGSGKTTLTENMLYLTGAIDRQGKVNDGNTVCDYDAEEIKRQVTISAAIAPISFGGKKINVIDCPGFQDFAGEVAAALRAVEAGIIFCTAKDGLSVGAERNWKLLKAAGKPVAFYVSKLDEEHGDYFGVLEALQAKYGSIVCPVTIPASDGTGVIDLVHNIAYETNGNKTAKVAVPAADESKAEELREALMETAAGATEELMEKYFEEMTLSEEELVTGIKAGLKDRSVVPVFCGVGTTGVGTQALLQAILDYVPAPDEVEGIDPNGPTAGLVFKTVSDQFGKYNFIKLVSGKLTADMTLRNSRTGNAGEARPSSYYHAAARRPPRSRTTCCGDIGAIGKIADWQDRRHPLRRRRPRSRLPAIEYRGALLLHVHLPQDEGPGGQGRQRSRPSERGGHLLHRHQQRRDPPDGPLRRRRYPARRPLRQAEEPASASRVELKPARVPYREKITRSARSPRPPQEADRRSAVSSATSGSAFEPQEESEEMIFAEEVFGGSVPKNFFPAVEKGLRDAVQKGVLAGYPLVNLKATLYDGSYHPVDSNEMAFKTAAQLAYKDGIPRAKPTILEPIGLLKVTIPDANLGDIMSDISSKRRGTVLGMTAEDGMQIVEAEVPMAEMSSYTIDLRSMTQGRGSFTCKFVRYEEAPGNVQQKVIEEAKALADAE